MLEKGKIIIQTDKITLKIKYIYELDLFYGVLIDLLTRDITPELISLVERESSYPVEEDIEKQFVHLRMQMSDFYSYFII